MIFIPEDKLFYFIKFSLKCIKEDFEKNIDEKNSILYYLFKEVEGEIKGVEYMDWYTQAKELFLRDNAHPRKLTTRMHFDASMASIPTIHLNLPGEQTINNGIGVDKGYRENTYDEQGNEQFSHTRGFQSGFNIIITSDNENEVLIIYHTLRAFFISMLDYLDYQGLRDPKISGGDLQFNPEIVPPHLFVRFIGLNFWYEVDIPSFIKDRVVDLLNVYVKGNIKIE